MKSLLLLGAILAGTAMPSLAAAAAAGAVTVAFTADTEGHVSPCQVCPMHPGMGGMARRGTALAQLRQQHGGGLVVADAGNALFGPESLASDGRVIAAAYDALGYDAVNLSYRDFRLGRDATLALTKNAKFAAVSANVLDAASGTPLVKPYIVKDAGGVRVALLGLTEAPAGAQFLPHLKKQLAGIKLADPAEALKTWLPKAKAEADQVVVLYSGAPASLARVRAAATADVAAFLVADVRPEQLPAGGTPLVAATSEHGKFIGTVTLAGGEGAAAQVAQVPVAEELAADAKVEAVLATYAGATSERIETMAKAAPAPSATSTPAPASVATPAAPAASADGALVPGKPRRLSKQVGNRGAKVTIATAELTPSYGAVTAAEGRQLLVVSTEWENVIPLTLIEKKQVPTEYKIPNLADHVYLVVDGSRLARLRADADELAGHLPVKEFKLERLGSRVRGNLLFDVPAQDVSSLELRFYDYAHGHFTVQLAGPPSATPNPATPAMKNEVVELAAFGVKKDATLGGRTAPEGMTFVTIDLRGRSLFTTDADATAFDPKAKPGQKAKLGYVADWKESRRYLQLVADGEYGYVPEAEATELDEEPRFLPDLMTGGRVVFLAPAKATSLELQCDFPNARASTGAAFRPKGLALPLEGKRPAPPQRPAIVSVDDDMYQVHVVGQTTADSFAGEKPAGGGGKFLVLDVTVNNRGKIGEFFQTKEQLKHADETGQQAPLAEATFKGVRRPAELVWIPAGERRSFQAVFEVPAATTKPRLAFTGVSKAEVLNLKPIGTEAGAADAKPTAKPAIPTAPMKAPNQAPADNRVAEASAKPNKPPAMSPSTAAVPAQAAKPAPKELPTRVTAKQSREPKGLAGVGLTNEQVNEAIDRGAEALWAELQAAVKKRGGKLGDGLGYDLLPCLALVHAGAHKKFPDFDAQLRECIATVDTEQLGTYGVGVLCMLIESYGDAYFLPKMREAVRCLLESQGPAGSWGYTARAPKEMLRDPNGLRVLQIRGGIPLEGEGADGEVMKRHSKPDMHQDGDNSTSQYALLGLWAGGKGKVRVPPEVWKQALAAYRTRQTKDGSWAYQPGYSSGYGSMTCAGICSVALTRFELGEAEPAVDESVERGLAWLANNFSIETHPKASKSHLYYYLYSLERVGRILDTEFIGEHEWYPLGAKWLLAQQGNGGTWTNPDGNEEKRPEIASSFALLFLTRATSTLNAEHKRGGDGTLTTAAPQGKGHRVYIILDCSGTMTREVDGVPRFEVARAAMTKLVEELPDDSEVALRAFGHRRAATVKGADEDTELLVPMGKLDRSEFLAKLATLRVRGKTPLSLTLSQAADDLRNAGSKEKPATLILVTDGGGDNTRPKVPVLQAAERFAKIEGLNFYVVGFDVDEPDWTQQLADLSSRGGGQYVEARQADALLRELRSVVFGIPEGFIISDAKGQPVQKAAFGKTVTLPEGKYTFATAFGGKQFSQAF